MPELSQDNRDGGLSIPVLRPIEAVRAGYHPRVLRAILFDFNGVLVDDEPIHLELFQRVLAEEGIALADGRLLRALPGAGRPLLLRGGARGGGGAGDRPPPDAADRAQGELLPGARPPGGVSVLRRRGRAGAGARGPGLDARRGDRRPARGGRGGAAAGGAARPLQGADHRRGRRARASRAPRGTSGPWRPSTRCRPCRSACSIRTRCSPSRTARWASPPPPRWGWRRSASPTPTPAHRCHGADAVVDGPATS